MRINIHWGEFRGAVERTVLNTSLLGEHPLVERRDVKYPVYKYYLQLKGYLPFSLFKSVETNKWISKRQMDISISPNVVFYSKKFIDEFEIESKLST